MGDELLNCEIFDTIQETRVLIGIWRFYNNTVRSHSALEYRPPAPENRVVDISLKIV
jgi:transposase InsO family protein